MITAIVFTAVGVYFAPQITLAAKMIKVVVKAKFT